MTITAPAPTIPPLPEPVRRQRGRTLLRPFVSVANVLRLIVRKILWILIRTIRLAWRHLLITLLVALGAYFAYRALVPAASTNSEAQVPVRTAPAIPPPASVRAYLEAQRNFDADRMWQALSPEAKARRLASGETLSTFRSSIQLMQQQGFRFGDSTYVGGYRLPDGQAYYFYVTEVSNANGQSGFVYQIFWVNSDGLIILADMPQLQ